MPDYGNVPGLAGPLTVYSGVVPTLAAAPALQYKVLATCPQGRAWKIEGGFIQNNHTTQTFKLALTRVPYGWVAAGGLTSDPLLRVFIDMKLVPREIVNLPGVIALRSGDQLYGYQIEETGLTTSGVNLYMAGDEYIL